MTLSRRPPDCPSLFLLRRNHKNLSGQMLIIIVWLTLLQVSCVAFTLHRRSVSFLKTTQSKLFPIHPWIRPETKY